MDLNPLDCRCQCTSFVLFDSVLYFFRTCKQNMHSTCKGCFFRYIILLVQLNNFSTGNRSCFINYNVACCLQVMYAGMRLTHTLTCLILGRRLFRSMAEIVQAQVCFLFLLLLSVFVCLFVCFLSWN